MRIIDRIADEYIKSCYTDIDFNSIQYKETKQAFIMGMWKMLHITRHEEYTPNTSDLFIDSITEYNTRRMNELKK